MFFYKVIDVGDGERVLVYRNKRLEEVLGPGRHTVFGLPSSITVERYDIREPVVEGLLFSKLSFLLENRSKTLGPHLELLEIADCEVGLLYQGKLLRKVLSPGSQVLSWKGVRDLHLTTIDINDSAEIEKTLLNILADKSLSKKIDMPGDALLIGQVPDEHVGLLFVNGRLQELLAPGRIGYWRYHRSIEMKLMDLRLQTAEVGGQEILTQDRVSLRINASANYRIDNAKLASEKLRDLDGFVYRELQLSLRELIGTKTLDELLKNKEGLNSLLTAAARSEMSRYGIHLLSLGIKDIILPGDMKAILNRVVEAQKEAEANLIKRREETQAMRSLHNTAKLMDNNPNLVRLKELEALEKVTGRIDQISVFGGLDGVLHDMVKLSPKQVG